MSHLSILPENTPRNKQRKRQGRGREGVSKQNGICGKEEMQKPTQAQVLEPALAREARERRDNVRSAMGPASSSSLSLGFRV